MKKIILLLIVLVNFSICQQTIRVATYNILNYYGTERNEYLRLVTEEIEADIIIVQEIMNQAAVDSFEISVLQGNYETIPFVNGPDTDNHMFYNADKLEFIADSYLGTPLRNIAIYILRENSTNEIIYFFSAHLKASQGEANEIRRLEECTILRNYLNQLSQNINFMLVGDLNFYYSLEPGYQKLIEEDEDYNGHLYDPINMPGTWHNNFSLRSIHTQSSRLEDIGDGGSTGGLDDRFDFILISQALLDNLNPGTYRSFGNDGLHFNLSINNGQNNAVESEVADAIYYGSDHLPVYCDFTFGEATTIEDNGNIPKEFVLYLNHPNPFNGSTTVRFFLPEAGNIKIDLFNSLGAYIRTLSNTYKNAGEHKVNFTLNDLASGIYYYVLQTEKHEKIVGKMLQIK